MGHTLQRVSHASSLSSEFSLSVLASLFTAPGFHWLVVCVPYAHTWSRCFFNGTAAVITFPVQVVLTVTKPGEKGDVPIGVIVGSVVAGLLLLALAVGLLWKVRVTSLCPRLYKCNEKLTNLPGERPLCDYVFCIRGCIVTVTLESLYSLGFSRESTSSFRGRPRKKGRVTLMRMKCCELKGKPAALLLHWIVSGVDSGSFQVQTDPSSITGSWAFVRKLKLFRLWMTSSRGLVFWVMWTDCTVTVSVMHWLWIHVKTIFFPRMAQPVGYNAFFFKGLRWYWMHVLPTWGVMCWNNLQAESLNHEDGSFVLFFLKHTWA